MKIYELEDDELARKISTEWKQSRDKNSTWRVEAEEDFNFVANHQWDDDDITKLNDEDRPVVTFNFLNAILAAILGMEANQRQETKFNPRNNNNTALADAITAFDKWVRDYGDIDVEEAQAFEHMLTCGMGWTETRMDYETDLDGKIIQEMVYPFEMSWDFTAKKRNLQDATWTCRGKKMAVEEIKEIWPKKEVEIDTTDFFGDDDTDDALLKFVRPEERYKSQDAAKEKGVKPTVLHFQWFETIPVYRAASPEGQVREFSKEEYDKIKPELDKRNLNIKFVEQRKRKYYQAFVVGSTLLEKKESPCQTDFTFKCITGKRDHVYKQWYGLIRLMKDPQKWSNKFFSQFMDIVASNAKGGVIAETDITTNKEKFEEDWAKTDSVIWVDPGTSASGKIAPKPTAQYPVNTDKLMQFSISSIYQVSGINVEMLGMVDREQAGVVEESRKRSGYTILAPYFDAFKSYKKAAGLARLEYTIKFMPANRIAEVLEPDLRPIVPMIKQLDTRQVNIIVSESPQSDNNKMIVWAFMSQIVPQLMKMGLPVPPEILEYSPLPATLVVKWKNLLEQSKQKQLPPEVQQQVQQIQQMLQKLQAENQKLKAREQEKMAELQLKKNISAQDMQLEMEKMQMERDLEMKRLMQEMEQFLIEMNMKSQVEDKKIVSHAMLEHRKMMMPKEVTIHAGN